MRGISGWANALLHKNPGLQARATQRTTLYAYVAFQPRHANGEVDEETPWDDSTQGCLLEQIIGFKT